MLASRRRNRSADGKGLRSVHRIAQFDVSRRIRGAKSKHAVQALFGLACAVAMFGVRTVVDIFIPHIGPFAMVYPTVLIATLFGHLLAGLVAWTLAFGWAWFMVLPPAWSFAFKDPADLGRVIINAASGLIVLVLAEAFRRAVRQAHDQLATDAERRLHLIADLEHRTKNNFALVAGMLDIQRRRHQEPAVQAALADASRRVKTFADAYSTLALAQGEGSAVAMKPYLEEIVDRLAAASFSASVTVVRRIEPYTLPREEAVAIGLYLNEALANCAKYAFADLDQGVVEVDFEGPPDGWRLIVSDNGCGVSLGPRSSVGGLGSQLMQAFAHQAGGRHDLQLSETGCQAQLTKTAVAPRSDEA